MSASAIVFTAVRGPQEIYRRAISEVLPEAGDALQARRHAWGQEDITAIEYRCDCGLCSTWSSGQRE
jgi:hypothetical protein